MKKRLIGIAALLTILFAACGTHIDNTTTFYRTDDGKLCVRIDHFVEKGMGGWHHTKGGFIYQNSPHGKVYDINGEYCKVEK